MGTYVELTSAGVPTRQAAALTGVPRATATRLVARQRKPDPEPAPPRPAPVNKLSRAERAVVLAVWRSGRCRGRTRPARRPFRRQVCALTRPGSPAGASWCRCRSRP